MKPLALERAVKSEADFATASREMRARKSPNFDAVCFHSQQCAEKLLKALLVEKAIPFSKTHDLIRLLDLLSGSRPEIPRNGSLHGREDTVHFPLARQRCMQSLPIFGTSPSITRDGHFKRGILRSLKNTA